MCILCCVFLNVQTSQLTAEIQEKDKVIDALEKEISTNTTSRRSSQNWHDRTVARAVLSSLDNIGFVQSEVSHIKN